MLSLSINKTNHKIITLSQKLIKDADGKKTGTVVPFL
jgi:hypothetical protein